MLASNRCLTTSAAAILIIVFTLSGSEIIQLGKASSSRINPQAGPCRSGDLRLTLYQPWTRLRLLETPRQRRWKTERLSSWEDGQRRGRRPHLHALM